MLAFGQILTKKSQHTLMETVADSCRLTVQLLVYPMPSGNI